jgi:hypothetical protein
MGNQMSVWRSAAFLMLLFIGCKKESTNTLDFVSSCPDCQVEVVSYPNGQKQWEYQMKDGKKHGLAKGWWPSGKLSSEKYYKNGVMHGPQRAWDESGLLLGSSVWNEGEMVR